MNVPGVVAAAVITLFVTATPATASRVAPAPAQSGAWCAEVAADPAGGRVGAPELVELSGLVASHAHARTLWAHNDSGDGPRLFAMDETGAPLGTFTVEGAGAIDWEEIATGPGPDQTRSYLYIGDIGDNAAVRDHVTVYRVPEPEAAPSGTDATMDGVEALQLTYPGGAEDAEAMFVDPLTNSLFIVTKQLSGQSRLLSVELAALDPAVPASMTELATVPIPLAAAPGSVALLPSTMVTAADISPDGGVVLLRTYQQVLAYVRAEGSSVADALAGEPCVAPSAAEAQGEAIAFSSTGDRYFTAGETQLAIEQGTVDPAASNPLSVFSVVGISATAPTSTAPTPTSAAPTVATTVVPSTITLATTTPATTTPAPTTPAPTTPASDDQRLSPATPPSSSRGWLIAATAILVAGIALVLVRRRAPR